MYRIKIEEINTINKLVKGRWTVISTDDKHNEYGYTPDREEKVEINNTIYTQEVESLNLFAVIEAINLGYLKS